MNTSKPATQDTEGPLTVEGAARELADIMSQMFDFTEAEFEGTVKDFVAVLRRVQPQPAQWLPISSAPKDGTPFLAYRDTFPLDCSQRVVRWKGEFWATEPGGWNVYPTHWTALPAAPGESQPQGMVHRCLDALVVGGLATPPFRSRADMEAKMQMIRDLCVRALSAPASEAT